MLDYSLFVLVLQLLGLRFGSSVGNLESSESWDERMMGRQVGGC